MRSKLAVALVAGAASAQAALPVGQYSFVSAVGSNLGLRHCDYQAYATPVEGGNDDFNFMVVPALSGAAGQFSVQSLNYPSMYLTVTGAANGASEATRLGIAAGADPLNSSFTTVPGLSNPAAVSITVGGGPLAGQYVTLGSGTLSGSCAGNYKAPAGDVYLSDGSDKAGATWTTVYTPPPPPPVVTIDVSNVTHVITNRTYGCHYDVGYTQQPRFWLAQMVYGESWEQGTMRVPSWLPVTPNGVTASATLDKNVLFNGKPSMAFTYTSGSGAPAGLANRGMGAEGMFLQGGKPYEGMVFAMGAPGTLVTVALQDFTTGTTLASTTLPIPSGGASAFAQLNFTLTPSVGTTCAFITPGSDPTIDCNNVPNADHACVRCGGQLLVGLSAPGASAHMSYVYLQPGPWGRVGDLPVNAAAGQLVKDLGINVIRQGGTVSQSLRWKDWRGPPWQRASMGHTWGDSLVASWGPFEMMALADYLNFEMVLTLAWDLNNATDWADLVEYVWGDAATTTWGALRAADGHPAPYGITTFELGNEQENPNYVQEVVAMETRARALGRPNELNFMYPTNQGVSTSVASQLVAAGIAPEHVMADIHIGAGGAIPIAEANFAANPGFHQSAVNAETNAGTHDVGRALGEASDIIDWQNLDADTASRMLFRTASFCSERSGHFDGFDQGIAFFLPNMTWYQPPGYVHAMLTATPADQALYVTYTQGAPAPKRAVKVPGLRRDPVTREVTTAVHTELRASGVSLSAQATADGSKVYVRAANNAATPQNISITLTGLTGGASVLPTVATWTLSAATASASNSPTDPTNVAPVSGSLQYTAGAPIALPGNSFTVLGFTIAPGVEDKAAGGASGLRGGAAALA